MTVAAATGLCGLPATELVALVRRRELSPLDVVRAHLDRIDEVNPQLGAVVCLRDREAIEAEARCAQRAVAGPLHGLPFTVKDSIATAGVRTTCGSRLLADHVPGTDATAVARMRAAGALLLGKTNCPEFALSMHTDNLLFGPTHNPLRDGVTPGGSSGGEAAAVAAGCSPLGLGTDYGGSLRWPAQCTGIVALRPTAGRVPGTGQLPSISDEEPVLPNTLRLQGQLQVVGPLARTVGDLELALGVIAGADGSDGLAPPVELELSGTVDPRELRVCWSDGGPEYAVRADVRDVVRDAAAALADLGLDVVEERPAGLERADALFLELRSMDGLDELSVLAGERQDMLGEQMRGLLEMPSLASVAEMQAANIERDSLRARVVRHFQERPILLWPVAALPAVDPLAQTYDVDGRSLTLWELGACNRAISLLGLPALAVTCGTSKEGLPVSVQVVGRPFAEHEVIAVGRLLERELGVARAVGPDVG